MFDEAYHARPPSSAVARRIKPLLAAFVLLTFSAKTALAASSSAAAHGGSELTQAQVLDYLYGGSFEQSGDDFLNSSVEVKRIDDQVGAEQIFNGDVVSARAVAAFSRNTQTLATLKGSLNPLFTVTGDDLEVSGSADLTGEDLTDTIFALQSSSNIFKQTDNGSLDSLRSYSVTGLDVDRDTFVLFWDDAIAADGDLDYNDLVVEVSTAGGTRGGSNVMIPLPAAAWSALSVMGGVSLMAGLRKIRERLR